MKKLIISVLCAIALMSGVCRAEIITDVSCELIENDAEYYIEITGKSYSQGEAVTVAIVEEVNAEVILDGSNDEIDAADYILYMNDTIRNKNSFTFKIPVYEEMENKSLHIRIGAEEETFTLNYMTIDSDKKEELVGYVNFADEDILYQAFFDNAKTYKSLGYKLDIYEGLDDEDKKKEICIGIVNGDRPYENPENAVNLAIFTGVINSVADEEGILETLKAFKDDTKMAFEDDEEFCLISQNDSIDRLCEDIMCERPYSSYRDFDEKYVRIKKKVYDALILEGILAEINSAKYDTILDVMDKYSDFVGVEIKDSADDMTTSNRDKFVRELCDTVFTGKKQAKEKVEELIKKYKKKKTYQTGGNSGGGGGSFITTVNDSKTPTFTTDMKKNEDEQKEEAVFNDLEGTQWAKTAIMELYSRGVVSGVGEKKFAPDAFATREQAVAMIVAAFNIVSDEDNIPDFTDTKNEAWYYTSVKAAYSAGIVSGVDDNRFGVGENITRQDFVTVLYRLIKTRGEADDAIKDGLLFEDAEGISAYAIDAVEYFASKGIVSGVAEGDKMYFLPHKNVTRAELAKILYGVMCE